MIGNVALDVVIGLVFIYLLYSLFATIIMEIVSSSFGLRARNLCFALRRMLMDERRFASPEDHKNLIVRAGAFLLTLCWQLITSLIQFSGKTLNMKNPELFDAFFKQPSIKTLCSGGLNSKPSYLTPENFTKGLIDSLKAITPDTGVLASVEEGIAGLEENSETKLHLQSLLVDSNYDLVKFKILVEEWFNDTMERATGWYKRSVRGILLIIAAVIAISFNIDTLEIINRLSGDKDAREKLVAMATEYVENNKGVIDNIRKNAGNNSEINGRLDSLQVASDSLEAFRKSLQEDINKTQTLLAGGWNIPEVLKYYSARPGELNDSKIIELTFVGDELREDDEVNEGEKTTVKYVLVPKSIDVPVLKKALTHSGEAQSALVSTMRYKIGYVFSSRHLAGYLLTVLAISLGAPFWFDLLNKLVKLRTSTKIRTESETGSDVRNTAANKAILNRVG